MAETKWTADRLLSLLGPYADVRTAVNGADPVAAALTPVVEPYVDIVAVASLVGHERIDLILETVARLQRIYAPVTLRVISSQPWPEYAELRRRSERLGIADQVEFAARPRGSKELYEQVKAARVFVSTSERDGSAASPLLALACGLPSITTSAPNNLAQYLVAEAPGGRVCEARVDALACEVVEVLTLPADRALPERLAAWLEPFTWERTAAVVAEVLRSSTSCNTR